MWSATSFGARLHILQTGSRLRTTFRVNVQDVVLYRCPRAGCARLNCCFSDVQNSRPLDTAPHSNNPDTGTVAAAGQSTSTDTPTLIAWPKTEQSETPLPLAMPHENGPAYFVGTGPTTGTSPTVEGNVEVASFSEPS